MRTPNWRYRHVVLLDASDVVGILSMRDIVRCQTADTPTPAGWRSAGTPRRTG